MPPPTTAPRAVKLGFDEDEFGTVTVSEDGTRFDFAGPNVAALKDSVRHYAEVLARDAKDDNALKGIKPDMILDLMLECMQGRAWCVDAAHPVGDDDDDDDPDGTDVYDDEPAPEPAEGEVENSDGAPVAGYTFADNGLLVPVGNVFCATGPGGGVDPTCSTGEGAPEFTVKPPKKLYRGVIGDGSAGAGTFSLGKGLYSTPSKGFLKGFKYDKIVELTPEAAFPRRPLVLRTPSHFADWLLAESGERRMSEFGKKYPDPGEFVRSRGFDGVVAGDEVVRYMPKDGA